MCLLKLSEFIAADNVQVLVGHKLFIYTCVPFHSDSANKMQTVILHFINIIIKTEQYIIIIRKKNKEIQ